MLATMTYFDSSFLFLGFIALTKPVHMYLLSVYLHLEYSQNTVQANLIGLNTEENPLSEEKYSILQEAGKSWQLTDNIHTH